MKIILRRAILPSILMVAALISIVYGNRFHDITIVVKEETEEKIDVPDMSEGMPNMGNPNVGNPMGGDPNGGFAMPKMKKVTVKKTVEVPKNVLEPEVSRDVTVGGVVRTESGDIKRTYSGKAPALCPT